MGKMIMILKLHGQLSLSKLSQLLNIRKMRENKLKRTQLGKGKRKFQIRLHLDSLLKRKHE